MPFQPQKEVPVRMAGDHKLQKHTNGGMLPTGSRQVEWTTLRREQLDNSTRQILQGMKAGQR
jgi:hypothetical protein